MKQNVQVIIFDFDGVIIDSWRLAYEMNLKDWPDLQPEQHRNFFNGNVFEGIAKMPPSMQTEEEKEHHFRNKYLPAKAQLPVFDHMDLVIKELGEQLSLAINTSARADATAEYLEIQGLLQYFAAIYGREHSQDKSKKFKKILDRFGVDSDETLFITDTVGDVLEAQMVGIPTIVVTWGYHSKEHLASVADQVLGLVDTPDELMTLINQHS